MKNLSVKGLTGIIMSSTAPEKLAKFYNDCLGIPLQLNKHGNMPEHWECDYNGIHYAILKRKKQETVNENIVLSFVVDDIDHFALTKKIELIHPKIDLGDGAYISSFNDTDGNTLRLWMKEKR